MHGYKIGFNPVVPVQSYCKSSISLHLHLSSYKRNHIIIDGSMIIGYYDSRSDCLQHIYSEVFYCVTHVMQGPVSGESVFKTF